MEHQEDSFEYTYSAPEQEEIKRIRAKYLPREQTESKMERLQRLDREAERPGMVLGLTLGVVGVLVFGTGMCCCMVWGRIVLGVAVGVIGAGLMAAAYPVCSRMTRRRREKIAPEMLELIRELGI